MPGILRNCSGLLTMAAMLAACGGQSTLHTVDVADSAIRGFSMQVMPESFARQGSGSFSYAIREYPGGAEMTIEAALVLPIPL